MIFSVDKFKLIDLVDDACNRAIVNDYCDVILFKDLLDLTQIV